MHNLGDYRIGSDSQDDSGHWIYVTHTPCGQDIYSGRDDTHTLPVDQLLTLIASHHCEATDG